MYNFLLNLVLYQITPRRYKQDYLIVLGAGLIDGKKVSRLLGARIDRAIVWATTRFYFLPNATIREFAGVFIMHKKRHFVIIGLIEILFIIQAIFAVLGWGKYIIA